VSGAPTRVLVVDDSALMRKSLSTMLSDAGDFEVHLARNGADALEQVPRIQPDVVTLDVNMPVMDGLTCLAEIMARHPVPVVMVSSLTAQGALVTLEALELGAVDFVEKPGGTVSLNLRQATDELVAKVRTAARARSRTGGLAARLRRQREEAEARRVAPPARRVSAGGASSGSVDLLLVGASTGGPALLTDVLSQLPAHTSASVLVAQHMPRSFTGALATRIDGACPLPVAEVTTQMRVEPGHVYIAQGDADMVAVRRGGALWVRPAPSGTSYRWHPSVDRMVRSAIDVVDPVRTVGVLLTGMGDDGAEEMARLRELGGRTIAESEESAVVWGMPGQLVARGGASWVLHARDIPSRLAGWL
jgi:two-component system chemotaxis response regulator CheB